MPLSRRRWLGATLALGGGGLAAEVASLAGAWDHRATMLVPGFPKPSEPALAPGTPRLTHIGHSCHLIEMAGQRWLTDPWFFNPAFGSLTHVSALGVGAVGPLDGIFISHRHADHFDPVALRHLDKGARIWTPDPSLVSPLRELGFVAVSVSNPWQTLSVGPLRVSFTPAVHDVPQHSLVLAGPDARVLFCGDTGAHGHWSEIRNRYRPTTALLPCDGTALRWEKREIMNPSEAAAAALELGCPQILQTHADASYTDPVARYLLSHSEADPLVGFRQTLGQAHQQARGNPSPGQPAAAIPDFSPLAIGETRRLFSEKTDYALL